MHCLTPRVVTHCQLPFFFLTGCSMDNWDEFPVSISKLGGQGEEASLRAVVPAQSVGAVQGTVQREPDESTWKACFTPCTETLKHLEPGCDCDPVLTPGPVLIHCHLSPFSRSLITSVPITKAPPPGSTHPSPLSELHPLGCQKIDPTTWDGLLFCT